MAKRRTPKSKHNLKTAPQFSIPNQPGPQTVVRRDTTDQLQPPSSKSLDQESTSQMLAKFHPDLLGELAYTCLTDSIFKGGEFNDASWSAPDEFQKEMRPKDPLERLALMQALLAHTRATWLSKLATTQKDVLAIRIACEAADRSSCTFGRLLRAIAEYRQPRNASPTVSIGQANLAHQQVVQNMRNDEGRKNAEQTRIRNGGAIDAEDVSAVEEGVEIATSDSSEDPTVDEKHGPKHSGGKGQGRKERAQTRRAVRRHRRIPKAGEEHD
jgi:hypothetical protein